MPDFVPGLGLWLQGDQSAPSKEVTMTLVKREIFVLFRIMASCLTAAMVIFFISSLSGEDLFKFNDEIDRAAKLADEINSELNDGIQKRLTQLGEVPHKDPFRKFYCVELAKEIHDLSNLTEKQRMIFDTYNVRGFESQLRRMMEYTGKSDVKSLMDELDIIKRELKNSTNLIEKKRTKLMRQRSSYIVLFFIFWVMLYLYFSRGIIFKKGDHSS
jgi:Fe2+ transport system protein B